MPLFNPPYIPDLYAPNQTVGDVVYFDGTNWTRLPIGASGSYLYTSGTTLPRWTTDLTGSLQRLRTGETYLAAGANVTITTQSNGQVIISTSATGSSGSPANTTPYSDQLGEVFLATVTQSVYRKSLPVVTANGWLVNNYGMMLVTTSSVDPNYLTAGTVYATGTGADVSASYIVIAITSSLPNERALQASTGLRLADGGAGGNVTLSINDGIVATVSGTTFTGPVNAANFSGSHHRLTTGESFIAAGNNIQVVTASNGQVQISTVGLADVSASYVTIGNTGSLPNERALSAGTGILIVDSGAGSTVSVGINNGIVATLTGSTFTGPVNASNISGSLQRLTSGETYLAGGSSIGVSTASNGQVSIAYIGSVPDPFASYLVLSATSSLINERVLSVSGSALSIVDAGGTAMLDIANTGSANTYGTPIAVNSRGQVTSGSTTWFGRDFGFVTASIPFHNRTTTFLTALNMTASNLSAGIYRLGWSYIFRSNTTTNAFRSQIVVGTTASHDTYVHSPNTATPERIEQDGFTYIRITGSIQLIDLRIAISAAATNTTASVYERALELWRVS